MNFAHWYHIFAAGEWRDPLAEHLAALEDGGFDGPMFVGIVGSQHEQLEVSTQLYAIRPSAKIVARAERGWEQVTLKRLQAYAHAHDGAVLYAHTKGAGRPSLFQDKWRQSMTHLLIQDWQTVSMQLEFGGYDAIGCHWLTAQDYPDVVAETPFPMFGGNFWVATCEYLRSLPPIAETNRHDAEAWIGLGDPNVLDLSPGWPGEQAFPAHRPLRRLVAGR